MQIPYEVQARPDTGLYNAKLGIWLFLASEVMLFGGLFSAYIFLRMGAEPGYWPLGLLNVPIGTINTMVLILSSVTVVLAWASLKMRKFAAYKKWMGITILCGALFLVVKLTLEYPAKFSHFGAYIEKDKWSKYEDYLGNKHLAEIGRPPRVEISGHLHGVEVRGDKAVIDEFAKANGFIVKEVDHHGEEHAEGDKKEPLYEVLHEKKGISPAKAEKLAKLKGVELVAFDVQLDAHNADPTNKDYDRANFFTPKMSDKRAIIQAEDVHSWSAFVPKHSTYFATYFMITGLHGLHVLGGVLVFAYFWGPGAALYRKNPEHLANRVEVAGLFWHFVDLVWIFVFPLFYLL
jgi:cytochrome c oxidase subunit 3